MTRTTSATSSTSTTSIASSTGTTGGIRVPAPAGVDVCWALLEYDGVAREVVARLKYRNERAALGWLADGMAALMAPPGRAVVTWVPTTDRRRRERGFDQAALLARAIARRWRRQAVALLVREGATVQTGRSRAERVAGVGFAARPPRDGAAPVVIVDDVVTTGTTLRCAAAALRSTGVPWVAALVAARTPPSRMGTGG